MISNAAEQPRATLGRNAAWLMVDYGLRLMMGAVVAALVTRHLGPERAGILSYAIALVAFAQPFSAIDSTVVNALVRTPERRTAILGTATALKLGTSVLAYLVLALAIRVLQPHAAESQLVLMIVASQLVFQLGEVADYDLQSRLQGFRIVRARVCSALIASLVRLALIGVSAPLALLAAVIPMEALLTSSFLVVGSDRGLKDMSMWSFDRGLARRLTLETWPLAISGLMLVASTHADKLLLGQLRGPSDVGIYFAAYQLSGLWYFLALIAGSSAAPDLARLHGGDAVQYKTLQQRLYSALTAAGILIAVVASLFAEEIVHLLFGPAFEASAHVLRIHVWTGIFVFHMHMRARILVIEGRQRLVLAFSFLTLLANLVLNALWIPSHGVEGAAYAAVVSSALCAVAFPLFFTHTRTAAAMFASSFNPLAWWRLRSEKTPS